MKRNRTLSGPKNSSHWTSRQALTLASGASRDCPLGEEAGGKDGGEMWEDEEGDEEKEEDDGSVSEWNSKVCTPPMR